jgi:pimeloyl-ACP methyl ester carboxylesterase
MRELVSRLLFVRVAGNLESGGIESGGFLTERLRDPHLMLEKWDTMGEMRKLRIPRWARIAMTGVGLSALLAYAVFFFFPLQLAELSSRYDLWQAGVQGVRSGALQGFVQDHCEAKKDCTCVALIHGLADNALTWKKILLWPKNGWLMPVKLYAFDLPGTGASPAPKDPGRDYRVRNQARAVREALEPLCSRWIVAGNSLGGWVASWLALDWPEGISKLILMDSVGLKATSDPGELEAFRNPTVAALKDFQRRAYFKGRELPDSVWNAAAQRMRESNAREVLQAQTADDYLDGRMGVLRRPTLLLWGQADQLTPASHGLLLKAQIPGAIWMEIPQCGHLPQKECPLDVIRAIGKMADFGAV